MANSRSNSRRRRVILDDAVQQEQPSVSEPIVEPAFDLENSYTDLARRGQLKTTDLIPKRIRSILIVFGVMIAVLAAINLLAIYGQQWLGLPDGGAASLQISGVGTLSAWFSSLLFLVTSMASLQIYGMRRHRCNDYNGHYRIWLLLAGLFLLASMNCVVDVRSLLKSLGIGGGGNSIVVLLLAKLVALTALVVRGVLEIKASKAALVSVIFVWLAYSSAIVTEIPGVVDVVVKKDDLIYGNLVLVGTAATFVATMFYARFVYLHANRVIKIKPAKKTSASTMQQTLTAADSIDGQADSDSSTENTDSNEPIARKLASNSKANSNNYPLEDTTDRVDETATKPSEEIIPMPAAKVNAVTKRNAATKKLSRKARKQQRKAA